MTEPIEKIETVKKVQTETFSFKKLIISPLTSMFWVKALMMGLGIGTISFIAYGVYKAYFKKPPDTQQQIIQIASPQRGSTINVGQKSEEKKSFMDPYLEVFVEGLHDFDTDGPFETKMGIRIGLRF